MTAVHAEIEYTGEMNIHSDICPDDCNPENLKDPDYRDMLHRCLDEWLDKSNGTGAFYIKNANYKIEEK